MVFGQGAVNIVIKAQDKFSAVFKKANLSMQSFRKAAIGAGIIGAALGVGLVKLGKSAAEIDTGFAKINTLLDEGQDAQEMYGEFVKQTNKALGDQGDQLDVLDAIYQTTSAGISNVADAQFFLEKATKAAVGGSAELPTVIEAGTKAMAAFGLNVEDAGRIFDVFAGTVKAGQTTMPQLAAAFPIVSGAAGEMGVTLEETAGILAGLTKVMKSPETAAVGLNAVLTGLIKPSDDMKDAIASLGFESGQSAIEQLGLMGTLKALKGTTDGSAEAIGGLFGNVRALRAVFPALGKAQEDIASSMDIVTNSTGMAEKQYEDMTNTVKFKWGEAMSEGQNLMNDIGGTVNEILAPVLQGLTSIISKLAGWWENLSPTMQKTIVIFTAVTAAVFLLAAAVALLTLVSSPWLLILLAIAAAITAVILVFMNWRKIMSSTAKMAMKVGSEMLLFFQRFADVWKIIWAAVSNAFIFVWNKIVSFYEDSINAIISGLNAMINMINKIPGISIPLIPEIDFSGIKVFTTRPDTILGATFLVLSPDHPRIKNYKNPKVKNYVSQAKNGDTKKEKTGVFSGEYVINPATKEKIPVWIADYVLMEYGTGAIMAVPDYDERDKEFAKKYNIKIKKTKLVNSREITKKINGKWKINYHLRDWVFSRQHYWGEPIPIIHCKKCGIVPVLEKDLPVELPYVRKYKPTKNGESPLAAINNWVNVACPKCGGAARRETDTMPNWAGSNWYYLAYIMRGISNFQFPISKYKRAFKYWMPVDLYNGGMEHTTLHLLYSRFIYKFLYDIKVVPTIEPYAKRRSHGMVLAEDGRKMSKSFDNVVNPDEAIKNYGADSLRLYEMFMGPFEQAINWSTKGLKGCYGFLKKVWRLFNDEKKIENKTSKDLLTKLHQTIKKVTEDLENMKFNTAIAIMMEFANLWQQSNQVLSKKDAEKFLKILAPFCPHISEELWFSNYQHKSTSIFKENWPKYDKGLIRKEKFELIIQINGKVRDKVKAGINVSENKAKKIALEQEKIKKWIKNKKSKKVIYIKEKLINIVI